MVTYNVMIYHILKVEIPTAYYKKNSKMCKTNNNNGKLIHSIMVKALHRKYFYAFGFFDMQNIYIIKSSIG